MNKSGPSSIQSTLQNRRRRQQLGPRVFGVLAVLLVIGGLFVLGNALIGPGKPISNMFASETPTPTLTYTPTPTSTATITPTETSTPTITFTPTPGAPFEYTVQEGDYLSSIAAKFNLGDTGIPLIILLNPFTTAGGDHSIDPTTQIVYPSQVLWIPNPDMQLPTATLISPNLPRGTKVTYTVQAGDTLGGIAAKFNTTEDAIVKENKITDPNALFVGQQLVIPVNLVTPTATRPPTSTPVTPSPTGTKAP